MELYTLKVFMTVATERSFSRAAEILLRSQPAITQAVQKLEREFGEQLLDRTARDLTLTDSGRLVMGFCHRFENLERELWDAYAELRDVAAGRLVIGASETTSFYLMPHLVSFRERYPKVKVQVRRSRSARLPAQVIDGDLEFGVVTHDPEDSRLESCVVCKDRLVLVLSPQHPLANREVVSIQDLGEESFIVHNVISPYHDVVASAFQKAKVALNMDIEMPTVDTIRMMVSRNRGVAFLPRVCVEQDLEQGLLKEVKVRELKVEREVRLVFPSCRVLSHAAKAFLYIVMGAQGPGA
jgi:DNA-binding transcriptional LysR family regulator